ncbi:hypothetical protein [Streptomyces sp. WMMC897]|uniref:hypothetical protein n=1 Tax=Streptomyces sp. WMMC897 TaxID=3014782 RepID=UPI0022B72C52|nr:hypothetical protein [Streptomyces sp. WMMC897]MCZ7413023.1 hypothetical protein [Streptomyces sp. WMMC897]MCZ7413095.1 hypothetical protein [Streptomyces sp. WMMC897]MCZ7415433.1 hypothetical protein [Streptomyces sp. WMMC897]
MTGQDPQRCDHCGQLCADTRPVEFIEAGSGPGWTRRACRTCVPHCPLDEELRILDRSW